MKLSPEEKSDKMSKSIKVDKNGHGTSPETPVIGVIATGENDDEISRIYLRAHAKGHELLITHEPGVDIDVEGLVEASDVHIIPQVESEIVGQTKFTLQQQLVSAAQTLSAPSLVLVEDTSTPIDFEESVAHLDNDQFVTWGVPESSTGVETLVAIPAYNEASTIETVVSGALEHADDVVVVDDGSSDDTASRARLAGATVVEHDQNRGYGAALQTVFNTADQWDVECLVIIDGDDQHDVRDISNLASTVRDEDTDVAIGSRFMGDATMNIPLYRRFGLGVVNVMLNLSTGSVKPRNWISDTQSGFRAYDRHVIADLADIDIGDDMDASLNILYEVQDNDYSISEQPTEIDYDVEGGHSQNPVVHGLTLVSTILHTVERKYPIKFIGVPGVVTLIFGLVFSYLTILNTTNTEVLPLGLGMAATFFVLAGIFSTFASIIFYCVPD